MGIYMTRREVALEEIREARREAEEAVRREVEARARLRRLTVDARVFFGVYRRHSMDELAAVAGISRKTLYKWIDEAKAPRNGG